VVTIHGKRSRAAEFDLRRCRGQGCRRSALRARRARRAAVRSALKERGDPWRLSEEAKPASPPPTKSDFGTREATGSSSRVRGREPASGITVEFCSTKGMRPVRRRRQSNIRSRLTSENVRRGLSDYAGAYYFNVVRLSDEASRKTHFSWRKPLQDFNHFLIRNLSKIAIIETDCSEYRVILIKTHYVVGLPPQFGKAVAWHDVFLAPNLHTMGAYVRTRHPLGRKCGPYPVSESAARDHRSSSGHLRARH
jgi:hypothetical protein